MEQGVQIPFPFPRDVTDQKCFRMFGFTTHNSPLPAAPKGKIVLFFLCFSGTYLTKMCKRQLFMSNAHQIQGEDLCLQLLWHNSLYFLLFYRIPHISPLTLGLFLLEVKSKYPYHDSPGFVSMGRNSVLRVFSCSSGPSFPPTQEVSRPRMKVS